MNLLQQRDELNNMVNQLDEADFNYAFKMFDRVYTYKDESRVCNELKKQGYSEVEIAAIYQSVKHITVLAYSHYDLKIQYVRLELERWLTRDVFKIQDLPLVAVQWIVSMVYVAEMV